MTPENDRRSRRLLVSFGAGLVIGVVLTIVVPKLVRPYLPSAIAGELEKLEGVVRAKQLETDRLLLTVPTEQGTILATFSRNVAEIDLLVQKGDSVTLEMPEYAPFVDNPRIASVKAALEGQVAERATEPPTSVEPPPLPTLDSASTASPGATRDTTSKRP
jgi:small basic protein